MSHQHVRHQAARAGRANSRSDGIWPRRAGTPASNSGNTSLSTGAMAGGRLAPRQSSPARGGRRSWPASGRAGAGAGPPAATSARRGLAARRQTAPVYFTAPGHMTHGSYNHRLTIGTLARHSPLFRIYQCQKIPGSEAALIFHSRFNFIDASHGHSHSDTSQQSRLATNVVASSFLHLMSRCPT